MWFLISTKILWIIWIITKLKLKNEILKSIFDKFFDNFFYNSFLIFMYKKKAGERYQNLSKEDKKATIWSWTLQKSLKRWKKLVEYKNIL